MKSSYIITSLNKNGISPKKKFGQNFLTDEKILKHIVSYLPDTIKKVYEIGTGPGTLTEILALNFKRIITIDIDSKLQALAKNLLSNYHNIEFINIDALKFNWFKHLDNNSGICGNLPYNIASRLIVLLLPYNCPMVFTLQLEVAKKITSPINSKDYGFFSSIIQFYYSVNIAFKLSKHLFFPKPNVDSAVVRFIPKYKDTQDFEDFKKFLKCAFKFRRKKLINNLNHKKKLKYILEKFKINSNIRAQELSPDLLYTIFKMFYSTN